MQQEINEEQLIIRENNKKSLEVLIDKAVKERLWIMLTYQHVLYSPKELQYQLDLGDDGLFFNACNYQFVPHPKIKSDDELLEEWKGNIIKNNVLKLKIEEGWMI